MALSPIQQRRWSRFKRHKRAYWSLWIFSLLFIGSLGAEWVANDRPLYIQFKQQSYWPILVDYLETDFGGDFETQANYHDVWLQTHIKEDGWMLWPPVAYSYHTHINDLPGAAPTPPSRQNWLGTDDQARDVFARILYGFRTSMLFALSLTLGSAVLGVMVGAIQGYFGGWIDLLGQRFLEIWGSLPALFLLIILASIVQPSFMWLLAIMLMFSWTSLVDVVRAEFLRGRNLDYVRAARALGVSHTRIMVRHILPNAMVATITFMPFLLTGAIGTLTSLDFLGFGLPPGSASLGELVAQAKNNLNAPWLAWSAFSVLSIMLTLLVFIGEGVRDAFDPRLIEKA